MKIALLGAGTISEQYLGNLTKFRELEVTFVADTDGERARARAEQFGIPHWGSPPELLCSTAELVVNLTPPEAHQETALAVLAAGKHLWIEKPLATSVAGARQVLAEALRRKLSLGCAPDTVLSRPAQAALRALASGEAGTPAWAYAVFETAGPQGWHPAPEFLFSPGGGPLLDMGPYFLTMLAHAFGPVSSVTAAGARAQHTRKIGSGPRAGTEFEVTVPTTLMATLRYTGGQCAQALFSFDSGVRRRLLEISGSTGTIVCADPNAFEGSIEVRSTLGAEPAVRESGPAPATRGIGVLQQVRALASGRPPLAGGEIALHIVEVCAALEEAARSGQTAPVTSTFPPLELLPEGWDSELI